METALSEGEAVAPVEATAEEVAQKEADEKAAEQEKADAEASAVEAEKLKAAQLAVKPGQKFIDAFGREKGGAWFAEGLTFEDAERAFTAEIKSDNSAMKLKIDELEKRLAAFAKIGSDPVSQEQPAASSSAKTFAQLVEVKMAATGCKRAEAMRVVAKENPAAWEATKNRVK